MTTTITPASGAAPLYTQQGTGTTPGYSALDDRRIATAALQEGVYGTSTLVSAGGVANVAAADFMVTQRGAGANLSVDINMPGGGIAFVQGDTIAGQGLYAVPAHSSTINESIAAADLTNPRVDSVILEVQDNVLDASGGDDARIRVLTGSPTASTNLTSRAGAAALPGSALLLADVLVAANATSIANSAIRDRRKWARGASVRCVSTSGNKTTSSTTATAIDSTNLQARVELSGVPVRASLQCVLQQSTGSDSSITALNVDGVAVDGVTVLGDVEATGLITGFGGYAYEIASLSGGSHFFVPTFAVITGGTATVLAAATSPAVFTVREIVAQNTANNTVTSG